MAHGVHQFYSLLGSKMQSNKHWTHFLMNDSSLPDQKGFTHRSDWPNISTLSNSETAESSTDFLWPIPSPTFP